MPRVPPPQPIRTPCRKRCAAACTICWTIWAARSPSPTICLQVQFENAGIAAGRFLVNTTIGVAGIFDVATDWGMPARNRDFGETMGTYGVPPGPYLVLPFRGSTDMRDFAGNYRRRLCHAPALCAL